MCAITAYARDAQLEGLRVELERRLAHIEELEQQLVRVRQTASESEVLVSRLRVELHELSERPAPRPAVEVSEYNGKHAPCSVDDHRSLMCETGARGDRDPGEADARARAAAGGARPDGAPHGEPFRAAL